MSSITIPGPAGDIECIIEPPRADHQASIMVVICHPHPQHGGTMNNKVVTTVAKAVQKMGAWSARFNYRGVGNSAGEYDNAIGEVDDLLAVVDYVTTQHPQLTLWLAGFSFGAYIAAKGATKVSAKQLISIAPSVENMDFQSLPEITIPWLVIQGDQDEIVSAQAVYEYVDSLPNPPKLIKMPAVGHFFHSRLPDLESALQDNLDVSAKPN